LGKEETDWADSLGEKKVQQRKKLWLEMEEQKTRNGCGSGYGGWGPLGVRRREINLVERSRGKKKPGRADERNSTQKKGLS